MNRAPNEWTDRLGAVASSVCALHCAICALLPAAFAALGVGALLTHEAEWLLTLVAVLFGAAALNLAWRTHRSIRVAGLLVVGIIGLLASRGLEMGTEHGDHHGDEHHVHAEEASGHHLEAAEQLDETGHASDEERQEAEGHEDGDGLHVLGAGIGVFSGLLLFLGHLFNIRAARRCREGCCGEDPSAGV